MSALSSENDDQELENSTALLHKHTRTWRTYAILESGQRQAHLKLRTLQLIFNQRPQVIGEADLGQVLALEVEARVAALPEQEVAKASLARGPQQQLHAGPVLQRRVVVHQVGRDVAEARVGKSEAGELSEDPCRLFAMLKIT